jgi:DNA repair protein RadC
MSYHDVFIREVRVSYLQTGEQQFRMRSPQDVAEFVRKVLSDNSREHCVALYFNGSNSVVSFSTISIGTANTATVHPREVFQRAISCGATSLVICHNHPSGATTLKEAGDLLGIPLLDHVIVTDSSFYSLKENGLC